MMTVAVIPARECSKRLPGKNMKPLGGKPLIAYTIDSALKAGLFGQIILTTDDPRIHRRYGYEKGITLDMRPAELAADRVQCARVLHYVIEKYGLVEKYDYLCLLLPTCPFRDEKHIRGSYEIVKKEKPVSVVGVRRYDFPPQFALALDHGRIVKTWKGIVRTDTVKPMYHPNGSLVWLHIKTFHGENMEGYYTERSFAYLMDWKASLDIDDQEGFEQAEMLLPYMGRRPFEEGREKAWDLHE